MFLTNFCHAQTFSGSGDTIPDDGTLIEFEITVSGLPTTIDTTNFGLEKVCFNILHTWDSDLDVTLVAPDGTTVLLTSGNGGDGDNFIATCFTNQATQSISQGSAPFTGNFLPNGKLGVVNNLQDPNGIWKLRIVDTYPFADFGILLGWNITFSNSPASDPIIKICNLPIVLITTNGLPILNDPKTAAHMKIIFNGWGVQNSVDDTVYVYDGKIGIEVRGSSSQMFPQKQYRLETRDSLGNNLDTTLLGMPAENDWILYAPYTDKSFLRNRLTYKLGMDLGMYNLRGQFCEVFINSEYKGVYELTETIKRSKDRVSLAKLTANDTIGDEVTGGYIVKIDWVKGPSWPSNYPPDPTQPQNNVINFQCVDPKPDSLHPKQQQYIQAYIDSFETVIFSPSYTDTVTGWRKFADERSFIDFFIMNEFAKNVDGYRLSTYFYKDKFSKGGKLHMGPLFDYNLAWHNADYCNAQSYTGWAYRITDHCAADLPMWWKRLITDPLFRNNLHCRWQDMRSTVLSKTYIYNFIDSMVTYIDSAQYRHYNQWPILGVYVWPNPSPLGQTYAEEIMHLKQWIDERGTWLDANMYGFCSLQWMDEFSLPVLSTYPNPATDVIYIDNFIREQTYSVTIYDCTGKQLNATVAWLDDQIKIQVAHLTPGAYLIKLNTKYKPYTIRFLKN
ncbi:MAG: CotH kinase family protein [Bacteroidetes bacterium]|nr:CotH kinase family protein [Bacteroidota bacterium]